MFVDTAYFIFYKTNKMFWKRTTVRFCLLPSWMLLGESAFLFVIQGRFQKTAIILDGTFSSVIQKKRLGDPLRLASVDVFLARRE